MSEHREYQGYTAVGTDVQPVRVVEYTTPYDDTPEGNARLDFDAWVYGICTILAIIGYIFY